MSIDANLQNVSVNGEWIEGDVAISVDVLGAHFNTTQHFKTKKDVAQDIDIGNGFTLHLLGTLEPPNKACITGSIENGILNLGLPKKCVPV